MRFIRRYAVGMCWCVALLLCTQVRAAPPIKLAVGEWPPYFSASLREQGVFAHIVKEAFAREGVAISYEFYPWKRALLLAQEGQVAGSPGWVMNDERAKVFLFSEPVVLSKEVLFFRKDQPIAFTTLADLKGKALGTTLGYSYGREFDAAAKSGLFTLDPAPDDVASLRKLLLGRVHAVVLNRAVGFELLGKFTESERAQIAVSSASVSEKQSRLVIAKSLPNGPQLMATFNQGLAKIVREGTVRRLLEDAEAGKYTLRP